MAGDSSRASSPKGASAHQECDLPEVHWPSPTVAGTIAGLGSAWSNAEADPLGAKDRLARLARAIETDVIPRLVLAHRPNGEGPAGAALLPSDAEVLAFVQSLINDGEDKLDATILGLRTRGVLVESVYLELFQPAARHLGVMWEEDEADFSVVTVALGRLQRLLRELSPAFGAEVEHPPHGRRALFVQPRDEQHSFGLSMVAEFFRRDGWDVLGGVGGAVTDPATKVRDEWVDIVGFSVGSDGRIPWLTETVRRTRASARNPGLRVLVGGPPFTINPGLAEQVGADGTARDGREAPKLAERLLSLGAVRR